ncbi:putative transcriptional regulator [Methylibium sp. T29-B]|uniref:helix-turn-helix transcriptional regulator n=1 Tax=Methylibium sp. T29-B TaxID=1437443 RepID=UPI0003F4151D|nr:AlpA family phage regulatory protein [Methylibium sp. T29-B]EWS60029.1 putative transcriptional regulator [Methylibium sp. T29-B]
MAHQLQSSRAILRRTQVEAESGYSRSTIYLRISQGLWTKPVSLGARAVGWPSGDVLALNAARIAGKTDEQIRALVLKLEANRLMADAGTAASALE